jgi:hypothetical protein
MIAAGVCAAALTLAPAAVWAEETAPATQDAVDQQVHCSKHLVHTDQSQRLVCETDRSTCAHEPDSNFAADEVSALVGRRLLPLPETVAFTTAARLWRRGLLAAPPGAVHYLLYPCIVSPRKLEEAGWSPTRSSG